MTTTTIRTVQKNGTTYYAIGLIANLTNFNISDYQMKRFVSTRNIHKEPRAWHNDRVFINKAGLKQIAKHSKSENLPKLKKFITGLDNQGSKITSTDNNLNLNSFYQFIFQGKNIRMITLDNRPYFLGTDVSRALGYEYPSATISKIKSKWKNTLSYKAFANIAKSLWDNKNDFSDKVVISEAGLNKLIFGSQLPQAEDMQDLVYSTVLPQIRATGSYSTSNTPQPNITAQDLHLLKLKEKAYDKAVEKIAFENSCYTMTQAAEQLGMHVRKFTALLKENGLIYYDDNSKIMATDPQSKFFYLKKFHPSKNSSISQTLVTPVGLENFRLMFVSDSMNLLDLLEA